MTVMPSVRSVGTVTITAAATTIPLPAGYAVNDLLVLFVETARQLVVFTNPGVWTELSSSPQDCPGISAATGTRLSAYYKVATSSEVDVELADSGNHNIGVIVAFRDVDTTSPIHQTLGTATDTAGTAVTFPSVTTTVANCLIVNAVASGEDVSGARVSGWTNAALSSLTEIVDEWSITANGGGLGIATGGKATAGSTGSTTATLAGSFRHGQITIALTPSSGDANASLSGKGVSATAALGTILPVTTNATANLSSKGVSATSAVGSVLAVTPVILESFEGTPSKDGSGNISGGDVLAWRDNGNTSTISSSASNVTQGSASWRCQFTNGSAFSYDGLIAYAGDLTGTTSFSVDLFIASIDATGFIGLYLLDSIGHTYQKNTTTGATGSFTLQVTQSELLAAQPAFDLTDMYIGIRNGAGTSGIDSDVYVDNLVIVGSFASGSTSGTADLAGKGVAATTAIGTVTASSNTNVSPAPTGISSTSAIGSITTTAIRNVDSSPVGISSTSAIGNATANAFTDVSPALTGVNGTGTAGTVTVTAVSNVSPSPTGISATSSVGIVQADDGIPGIPYIMNGLIVWLRFEEGSGTVAADSSGNGLDGTLVNGPIWDSETPVDIVSNYSLHFDGSNDNVAIADNALLDISSAFTMCMWVKSDGAQSNRYLLSRRNDAGVDNVYSMLYGYGGSGVVQFYATGGHGYSYPGTSSNMTIPDTNWHHVAYTFNGTTYEKFLDGVSGGTTTLSTNIAASTNNLLVGSFDGSGNAFDGYIDDVRLYDRALSATEIANIADGDEEDININQSVTGNSLTLSAGDVVASIPVNTSITGISVTSTGGVLTIITAIDAQGSPTGINSSTIVGTILATGSSIKILSGLSATTSLGTLTLTATSSVTLTSNDSTSAIGTLTSQASSIKEITGVTSTLTVNTPLITLQTPINGNASTLNIGVCEATIATPDVNLTGNASTGSPGNMSLITTSNILLESLLTASSLGTLTGTSAFSTTLIGNESIGHSGTVSLIVIKPITGNISTGAAGTPFDSVSYTISNSTVTLNTNSVTTQSGASPVITSNSVTGSSGSLNTNSSSSLTGTSATSQLGTVYNLISLYPVGTVSITHAGQTSEDIIEPLESNQSITNAGDANATSSLSILITANSITSSLGLLSLIIASTVTFVGNSVSTLTSDIQAKVDAFINGVYSTLEIGAVNFGRRFVETVSFLASLTTLKSLGGIYTNRKDLSGSHSTIKELNATHATTKSLNATYSGKKTFDISTNIQDIT